MANTLPIQRQSIEAYHEGNFIGYVNSIITRGASVICVIRNTKRKFTKRNSEAVTRSAKAANICDVENIGKLYNQRDDLTFKIVPEVKM